MASEETLQSVLNWSSYVTSSTLVILSIYAMYKVRNGSRFEFLTLMLFGLIVTNICYILYVVIYGKRRRLELDKGTPHSELLNIVALSMTFDLLRYFAWQLTMWVFAFKYWVISIEIPKAITKKRSMGALQEIGIRELPP